MQSGGWGVSFGAWNRGPGTMYPGEKFQEWTTWTALFLIIFPFMCHSQTLLTIINSSLHLEVSLGQNVTLPCVLTDSYQPQVRLNLQNDSVRWDMRSVNGSLRRVYLLTTGVHTAHRPNSNIDENDFRRGIASLSMRDVLEGDEGEYTCSVYVTPHKLTATISVQVSAKPTITLTSHELTVEPGHEKSVICEVTRFYPKSVTIRWFKSRKHSNDRTALDKETCNSVPAENNDGTFNATSLIFVKPSSTDEDGDIYFCIVSHRSFKDDQVVSLTLTVKEQRTTYWGPLPVTLLIFLILLVIVGSSFFIFWCRKEPEVSRIFGAEYLVHMQPTTLRCSLSYFKFKTIKVNVYLRRKGASKKQVIYSWRPSQEEMNRQNGELEPLATPAKVDPLSPEWRFFFYSCSCDIKITPNIETDDEAELTVQVKCFLQKTPITRDCKLKVNGDCLKLQPIRAPEHLTHDQEVTLTCDITKYSPGPLHIKWLKKDLLHQKATQVICEDGNICDERYKHSQEQHQDGCVYTVSSSLTFTANVIEDHGKKYVCQAFYPALGQTMESAWDTYVRAVPVLQPITSKPKMPSAGQQMELSCNILSFHPQELTVEWYIEDDLVPQTEDPRKFVNDGLFSVRSTLKHTFKMEDLGKKFKCKVDHESFTDPKILEWTVDLPRK